MKNVISRTKNERNGRNGRNGMKNVYYLGITSLLSDVSTEMISPIIPIFLSSIGATGLIIGLIEGVGKASEHILSIFSGWISDKLKKRKFFATLGYLISALMKGFFSLISSWELFLVLRTIERSGKAIRNPPRDALIAESLEGKATRKGFATHRILDTLGAILGPLITIGIIYFFSAPLKTQEEIISFSKSIFLFSMFFGVISVLVIFLLVSERRKIEKKEKIEEIKEKRKEIWKDFKFSKVANSFLVFSAIFYIGLPMMAIFYLKAASIGLSIAEIFLSSFLFNFSYVLGAYFCKGLKIKSKKILSIIVFLTAINLFFFSFASNLYIFFTLFFIFGFLFGIFEVETKNYIQEIEKSKLASLYGAHRTITGISILISGVFMGFLWDYFRDLLFFFSFLIVFASLFFFRPSKRDFKNFLK
ncbi:MAG: MFS transporter [Candidatus Micrarchaeia archaeon]